MKTKKVNSTMSGVKTKKIVVVKPAVEAPIEVKTKKASRGRPRKETVEVPKIEYTPNELSEALFKVKDYLGRAQVPFMVGGNTIREIIRDGVLSSDPVHVLVLKKHLTQDCEGMLETIYISERIRPEISEKEIKFNVGRVPVRIQIIHRKYQFFGNPSQLSFDYDHEFKQPNPIDKYLKSTGVVR